MKKELVRDIVIFSVGMLITAVLIYFLFQPRVRREMDFFLSGSYYYIIYVFLGIAGVYFILKWIIDTGKIGNYLKFPYFLVFLPIAIFPIIRCYFKVPYIFCHACPKKCPWGVVRPVTIPAFLALNLNSRLWCFKLCPIGTIQDYQCKVSPHKICLPEWTKHVRYLFLAFTVIITVLIALAITNPLNGFFYTAVYFSVLGVLIAAAAIFIFSFLIPRLWCNYFCPIGSFSDLALKAEYKLKQGLKAKYGKKPR